jgi:preprotein translocase subunit YajC
VDNLLPVLPFVGIALLFWLLFLRPAQRRQQAMNRMQGDLHVGDEVMLTSGIIGVLRSLDGETVQLQVSEGVTVRVVRAAIGKVTTPVARDDDTHIDTQLTADPVAEPEEK